MNNIKIGFDITEPGSLPHVTLYHTNKKYRFLIDTGSSHSWLSKKISSEFLLEGETTVRTRVIDFDKYNVLSSTLRLEPVQNVTDDFDKIKFHANFISSDLEGLDKLNMHVQEQIHGILGMDFLVENCISVDINNRILVA
jgi:hypothetical protein